MRRQFPCSNCGFACASTWRSLNASAAVICNKCRSKGGKTKVVMGPDPDPNPNYPNQEGPNINLNFSINNSSDFEQISPSSSDMHQNVALTVNQIGMIFGNLPFEPTLVFPLIEAKGNSQEPKVKTEVFTADDDSATGAPHHFYCGKSSTTSLLSRASRIQIKQEYDCEPAISDAGNGIPMWDAKKVQKKKRTKLPQYSLSPLARFIIQLQHASCNERRHSYDKSASADKEVEAPKYDDVLIYEKCKYVADNEIGLGAMLLLSPPVTLTKPIKEEPSSTY